MSFVFIHPFSDGNGRMARLWHTAILAKWKRIFEYIPIESQIEKFQSEYYEAIAKCHVAGESTFFIEFMLSQIDKILDEITIQVNEEDEYLSETVKNLLDVMEYDIPYTSKTLMEKLKTEVKRRIPQKLPAPCYRIESYSNDDTRQTKQQKSAIYKKISIQVLSFVFLPNICVRIKRYFQYVARFQKWNPGHSYFNPKPARKENSASLLFTFHDVFL